MWSRPYQTTYQAGLARISVSLLHNKMGMGSSQPMIRIRGMANNQHTIRIKDMGNSQHTIRIRDMVSNQHTTRIRDMASRVATVSSPRMTRIRVLGSKAAMANSQRMTQTKALASNNHTALIRGLANNRHMTQIRPMDNHNHTAPTKDLGSNLVMANSQITTRTQVKAMASSNHPLDRTLIPSPPMAIHGTHRPATTVFVVGLVATSRKITAGDLQRDGYVVRLWLSSHTTRGCRHPKTPQYAR